MPFNIDTFRQHLKNANSSYSRFKESSLEPLEKLLEQLGTTVGPTNLQQIQSVWAAVDHEKQQKYVEAAVYLKQFVPELVHAIPVKPEMEFIEFRVMFSPLGDIDKYPMRFYHVHSLTWKSSNGDLDSLNNVGTRERVTHRTNPAGPPFNSVNAGIPMTFTQGATTANGANCGSNKDDHSIPNPSLNVDRPIVNGSVIADQVYEYTTDGVNWYPIPGAAYEIEKGVRDYSGQKVFFFRKQSAAPNQNNFHFEVEYPIGPALPVPENRVPVIPAGFASKEQINNYTSRVIHKGKRG